MNTYYHIVSYAKEPATAYGIAVNENGIVASVPFNRPELDWMKGRSIQSLIEFFETKPACITEVKSSQTNDDETSPTSC